LEEPGKPVDGNLVPVGSRYLPDALQGPFKAYWGGVTCIPESFA
jgi:hypothetical protein